MAMPVSGQNDSPWQSFAVAWQNSVQDLVVALQQASVPPEERRPTAGRITAHVKVRHHGLKAPRRGGYSLRTGEGFLALEATLGGHIIRRTGMAIDSDGAPNITTKQDPHHRKDTSMRWDGHYVDAATVPYMVMPLGGLPPGVQLGDLARVSYNGHTAYAIIADRGGVDTKTTLHGEGSVRLAQLLGINANPKSGGVDSGVTYEVIPGSGKRFGIYNGGPAFTDEQIQAFGLNAFDGMAFSATA